MTTNETITVSSQGNVESIEKTADHYSQHPVTAGGKGQIFVKIIFDGVLRDFKPGDTHTEIERVNVSGTTLYCLGDKTWRQVFDEHEIEVGKGRSMTLIVKNTHESTRPLRVTITMEPRAVSAAIQAGNKIKAPAVTQRISRGPTAGKKKFSKSRANAAELVQVSPNEGERAILLIRGHVHGLLRFFEHHVPLHPSHLSSLRGELDRALVNDGTVTVGGNEVAAVVSYTVLEGMIVSIRAKRSVLNPIEVDEVVTALNHSLRLNQSPPKKKFALTPGLVRNPPAKQMQTQT